MPANQYAVKRDNPYASDSTSPDDAWEEGYQAGAENYGLAGPDPRERIAETIEQARRLVTHLRLPHPVILGNGWNAERLALLGGDLDDALELLRG